MPKQDPTTRDNLLLINAGVDNQRGIANRWTSQGPGSTPYHAQNIYLRNNWGTVDRFRGVQGQYLAYTENPGGISTEVQNYSTDGVGQFIGQTANIDRPLHVTRTAVLGGSPVDNVMVYRSTYLLEPNHTVWNNGARTPGTVNLLKTFVQDPGINEGDPYYGKFLQSGFQSPDIVGASQEGGGNVAPIFNRQGRNDAFLDHTFRYLKPSEDLLIRAKGGLDIQVEPVYNFYLDTMPPYETVTADTPEYLLPNFYIFEAELRNTGSEAYTDDYYQSITLFNRIQDWFVQGNASRPGAVYSESQTKSYYQSYVSTMRALNANGSDLETTKAQFTGRLKNVAVLHSDIDAINKLTRADEKTSGLLFLPFYNIITVGEDEFAATTGDFEKARSWFRYLDEVPEFDNTSFLDLLQMYIIMLLEKGNPVPATFHEIGTGQNMSTTITSSLYVDLSRGNGAGSETMIPGLPTQYQGFISYAEWLALRIGDNNSAGVGNDIWKRDNIVLIRDYADDGRWTATAQHDREFDAPDAAAVRDFYSQVEDNTLHYPMRNFESVLANNGAHSETLFYKIDKRVVDREGNIDPTVVQTIYLSRRISDPGPLQYIDSQVRYGVRYQYDIQEIRVVFGNKYYYDDLKLYYAGFVGYGRAVGNALGFYQATHTAIKADTYAENIGGFSYTNNTSDTKFSEVQNGYFVIDPSDPVNDWQWTWAASGSDWGETEKLDRVGLIVRVGWGFLGNQFGGIAESYFDAPAPAASELVLGVGTVLDAADLPELATSLGAIPVGGVAMPGGQLGASEFESIERNLADAAQEFGRTTVLQFGGSSGGPLPPILTGPDALLAPGGASPGGFGGGTGTTEFGLPDLGVLLSGYVSF